MDEELIKKFCESVNFVSLPKGVKQRTSEEVIGNLEKDLGLSHEDAKRLHDCNSIPLPQELSESLLTKSKNLSRSSRKNHKRN